MGASGDLAPLSHLALGLMGEGLMWSPSSGWANAADVSLSLPPATEGNGKPQTLRVWGAIESPLLYY